MKTQWEELYSRLLIEINQCKSIRMPEMEMAETCFRIATNYWIEAKLRFMKRIMQIDDEEMEFFKEVKPLFACHMEFYFLVSQGLLFIPEQPAERKKYWEEESRKQERFAKRHPEFIKYYESKQRHLDFKYFLQRNNGLRYMVQEKVYNDQDCRTSHDHLVRSCLANRMYNEFVKKRLEIELAVSSGQ